MVTLLETSITKLDISSLSNIFSDFKTNLMSIHESQGITDDWSPIYTEIELAMALNPAVDPEEKIQQTVSACLSSIREINSKIISDLSNAIGSNLVAVEEDLVYALPTTLSDDRAILDRIRQSTK